VSCWFSKEHRLLPQFQKQLDEHTAAARGRGPGRVFAEAPAAEAEIKRVLLLMRAAGAPLNSHIIRWVMHAIMQERCPALLRHLALSQTFISVWARSQLDWRWRARTTAASKLPADWEGQGVLMAKRIGAVMEMHKVRISDSTRLESSTAHLTMPPCVLSLLPGASLARSQATMQQYISEILLPHAETCIQRHRLHADAKILLVLDVWSVHKSEEFRMFLRTQHPRIHLVFVPANCTSKLQVADVALQRPFKHGITSRFNEWAAQQIKQQIHEENIVGLNDSFKMGAIKPLVLQWCIDSWSALKEQKQLILDGWTKCCTSLFNVMDPVKRNAAVSEVAKRELEQAHVPEEDEEEKEEALSELDEDGEEDELDVSTARQFGERRSDRKRTQAAAHGFQLDSSAIAMTEDSDE
jgi:hypothetical protein